MKKFLLIVPLILLAFFGMGQNVPILGDTTKIYSKRTDGRGNELIVRNATKDTLGLLTNTGGGLSIWKRPVQLSDSSFIVGSDTIVIRGTGGGSSFDSTNLSYRIDTLSGIKYVDTSYTHEGPFIDTLFYEKDGNVYQTLYLDHLQDRIGLAVTHDTLLTYDVTAGSFPLNGTRYVSAGGSVTLPPADATLDKFVTIAVNTSGTIVYIDGTPAVNPEIPQVGADEFFLTAIRVDALATVGTGQTQEIIYDENTEWSIAASAGLTINANSTTHPFHLAKEISVSAYTTPNKTITFTHSGNLVSTDYTVVKFFVYLPAALASTAAIRIQFLSSTNLAVSNALTLAAAQGFNRLTAGSWQNISVPIPSIAFTNTTFSKFRIILTGTNASGLFFDYIQLQGGIVNTTTETDPVANAKTVTVTGSTDVAVTGGAQALNTNPAFTLGTVQGIKGSSVPTLSTGNLRWNGSAWVFDNTTYLTANQAITVTATGDATGISTSSSTAPSLPLTLATVNSNVGSFGSATQVAQVTVNAKGLTTAVSNVTITPAASSITGGAALTKVDDTNVTLTLGGTPATSLLTAASLTLGWTGSLSIARGGTNNGSLSVTAGTLYYGDGTKLIGLAPGTARQHLTGGTTPAWVDTAVASSGVLSLSAIGSSANANGGTITGTVLNLEPASASFGGVLTTATQTFAGIKTDLVTAIGAARGDGFILQNTTPATVSVEQYSPSLVLEGRTWLTTAGGSSNTNKWAIFNRTAQNSSTIASTLAFQATNNAGTYSDMMTLSMASLLTVNAVAAAGSVTTPAFPANGSGFWTIGTAFKIFGGTDYHFQMNNHTLIAADSAYKLDVYGEAALTGGLVIRQLAAPVVTLSTSGTPGSTTITYTVVAKLRNGTTVATDQTITTANATLSLTNFVTVSCSYIPGVYQWLVYRKSTNGTSPSTTGLINTTPAGAPNGIAATDKGLVAGASEVAAVGNNTGNLGVGLTLPTAALQIRAGIAGVNGATFKLNTGVASQTVLEDNAFNFDGDDLYVSDATYNYKFDKSVSGSATLDFGSTGSGAVADLTITVTGAAVGDVVMLGVPNGSVTSTAAFSAWVSATNTVTVRFSPKATEDPSSGTFKVRVIK